jgi:hypothetical protein
MLKPRGGGRHGRRDNLLDVDQVAQPTTLWHLLPTTGTQFAGTHCWVCRIYVTLPMESVAPVDTLFSLSS